ncbi:pilus assembly protein PilM, partial [Thermodesulfobacteriota bacterium]
MAQRVTGIDIGTASIKAVRLKSKLSRFEYESSYAVPIDQNAADRESAEREALTSLIKDNHLENDILIAAVQAQKICKRFITLPFTERKKIEQVLSYEIENHVPFSSDDIVTDYQLISKEKGE